MLFGLLLGFVWFRAGDCFAQALGLIGLDLGVGVS